MVKRVGIPRALLYYQHYPLWKTFFEELGAEVVVSPPTNKAMLSAGSARMVAETCLPAKVFCGHVIALADKVDYVFIPSVRSLEPQVYNCSKFLGLPDVIRTAVPESPQILDIEIDVSKGEKAVRREIHTLGKCFTANPFKINRAYEKGEQAEKQYQEMLQSGIPWPEAIGHFMSERTSDVEQGVIETEAEQSNLSSAVTVAVVGHPYNIYDTYINHNLLSRLRKMGVRVMTTENAPQGALDAGTASLVGRPYWTYEDEVVGAAGHYLEDNTVDGVMAVVCFGCGPDSMMLDVVQRAAKQQRQKPFSTIVIDEHTGEAGLITRLEAFVDMLQRRKRKAEGKSLGITPAPQATKER